MDPDKAPPQPLKPARPARRAPLGLGLLLAANTLGLALRSTVDPLTAAQVLLQPFLAAGFVAALLAGQRARLAGWAGRARPIVTVLLTLAGGALGVLVTQGATRVAGSWVKPLPTTLNPLPASLAEEALGGTNGPFYPAAARTATGAPLPAQVFVEAQSCGRSGCHPQEVAEWQASPHRWSGFDNPWYRATLEQMHADRGPVAARWCASCHTPALLLAGGTGQGTAAPPLERQAADPLATVGVTCLSCHGATEANAGLGQGSFGVGSSWMHELALAQGGGRQLVHDALVHLAPELHKQAYRPAVLAKEASTQLCGSCHKGHYDQPVSDYRYTLFFSDYDSWQSGAYSGESIERVLHFPEPQGCVDCHMSAPGGAVSHRFAGANTALAALRDDREQLAAVEQLLKGGAVGLDLFALSAGRPTGQPVAVDAYEPTFGPLDRIPATVQRGHEVRLDLVVKTPGVGHLFPGSKVDIADCWVELTAEDEAGRRIFESGLLAADGSVDPAAHLYRSVWVDAQGERVDNHAMWNAVTAVYNRRIEPHAAGVVRFRLTVPPETGSALTLRARLLYRTFPASFTRWAFERTGTPAKEMPIVEMARAEARLAVVDAAAALPAMVEPPAEAKASLARWSDYAIGLALQGDLRAARDAFQHIVELDPQNVDAWINLGRLAVVAGDVDEAREVLGKALALEPENLRALLFLGGAERAGANLPKALELLRRVAARYPRDLSLRTQIAAILAQQNDLAGAAAELEQVVAVNPHQTAAHLQLVRFYRALGRTADAEAAQARFERYKDDETSREVLPPYLERHPHDNLERQRLHEHRTSAAETP